MREAKGENSNPLFFKAKIKKPLISKEIKNPQFPVLHKIYEYDLMTEEGKEYLIERGSL